MEVQYVLMLMRLIFLKESQILFLIHLRFFFLSFQRLLLLLSCWNGNCLGASGLARESVGGSLGWGTDGISGEFSWSVCMYRSNKKNSMAVNKEPFQWSRECLKCCPYRIHPNLFSVCGWWIDKYCHPQKSLLCISLWNQLMPSHPVVTLVSRNCMSYKTWIFLSDFL